MPTGLRKNYRLITKLESEDLQLIYTIQKAVWRTEISKQKRFHSFLKLEIMPKPIIKYQQLTFVVASAGQQIPIDAETDKLYNTCTGINILLTDENAKFSTLHLDINSQEVFPENFEVIRIRFREFAPFGYDYHTLRETAGGSRINGKYTDKGGVAFPYSVTISFRLENKD